MITILTDPLPVGYQFIAEWARWIGRIPRNMISQSKYKYGLYRGHFAVTRSLVEGLKKNGLPYSYNPTRRFDLTDTVVVLAGIRTLKQAIKFKKNRFFKKLYAGPNVVVFSSDYNSLLASPEVDAAITPSDWVVDLYVNDNPSLLGRCFAWPAGVDVEYWKPPLRVSRKQILILEKQNQGPVGPVAPYAEYLQQKGYPVEIIRYGSFRHPDYRDALHRTLLMIGFVASESQGIAWAEAWAANVPTLILRNQHNSYKGRCFKCSTAPYLNSSNGLFFNDLEDFKKQFSRWEAERSQFAAREWVHAHMSDEVCARNLYELVTRC